MLTLDVFSVARPKEQNAKRYQFSLRITNVLRDKISRFAEYEQCTFAEAVVKLLERGLDAEMKDIDHLKKDP